MHLIRDYLNNLESIKLTILSKWKIIFNKIIKLLKNIKL